MNGNTVRRFVGCYDENGRCIGYKELPVFSLPVEKMAEMNDEEVLLACGLGHLVSRRVQD
jgi:hypothetical protein